MITPLFNGPLDIIGDIHGEIDALRSLVNRLGYDKIGDHPQSRRLIFLGDLTDRGPDSPAVIELVSSLIESGKAQCVLGNHDFNILVDHRKPENKWFWGEEFVDEHGNVVDQRLADAATQKRVLDFFRTLPIALERDDLRIVHACWNDEMIEMVRGESDVVKLYERHAERIDLELADLGLNDIDQDLAHQNRNPVKLLSSGPEERSEKAVFSGGKVRNEKRVIWWPHYNGPFCVFGHYSILDGNPRGNAAAFCADFGVGHRWRERREGITSGFSFRLAAMRFPEKRVVFDDGAIRAIHNYDEQKTRIVKNEELK